MGLWAYNEGEIWRFTMKYFVLVLLLCSVCLGADKYVNSSTGTDDGAVGRGDSAGDPYATIQFAVDNFSGSANDTIFVADGTYLEAAGSYGVQFVSAGEDSKAYTIKGESRSGTLIKPVKEYVLRVSSNTTIVSLSDMTIESGNTGAASGRMVAIDSSAVTCTVIVNNCTLGTASTSGEADNQVAVEVSTASKQHSIVVQNSTLYSHGDKATNFLQNCQTAIFDTCIIDSNGTGASTRSPFWVRNDSDSLVVKNCTITSETMGFYFDEATSVSVGIVECFNNSITTVEETFFVPGVAPSAALRVNKAKFNNNTVIHDAANACFTVHIGTDTTLNEPLELIEIRNNNITRTNGTGGEHVIFLAPNMEGADVSNNKVDGGGFGLVIKGKWHTVKGNLIIQGTNATTTHAAYIKGCYGCTFINNTIIANSQTSGAALVIMEQNGITVDTGYNIIKNNIFDGRGGHYAMRLEGTFLNNILDYNDYQGGDTGFVFIDSLANPTDLATLQSMWASNATTNEGLLNDSNSLEVDPQFDSTYKPKNPQLLEGGEPDANDKNTSIGASSPPLPKKGIYGFQSSIYKE
jgi:hypothetical protein